MSEWRCGPECPRWSICTMLFNRQHTGDECKFSIADMEAGVRYEERNAIDANLAAARWRSTIAARKDKEAEADA